MAGMSSYDYKSKEGLNIRPSRKPILISALSVGAVALWFMSLPNIDLQQMNDLGLVSVMPLTIFLALGFLSFSFSMVMRQDQPRTSVILFHLVVLVFILYGTPAIVEQMPRTAISWKLVGLINTIRETGTVNPYLDAFNNWPGFFILIAFLTDAIGLENPLGLATWTPVILNLLYMGPLLMIFRAGTDRRRLVWLGVWFFYLYKWIGQDYLSPQGFSYLFYLTILGILLTWFKTTPEQPPWFYQRWLRGPLLPQRFTSRPRAVRLLGEGVEKTRNFLSQFFSLYSTPDQPSGAWQRVGLLALVSFFFAIVVPSHQLTPFAILAAVIILVLFNRVTPRGLPVFMLVLAGLWISYMTLPYLTGHIDKVITPVGSLGENLSSNLADRIRGSEQHRFILFLRILTTVVLLFLALLGGIRLYRIRRLDATFVLLAIVPYLLIGGQVYGGEILLRSYLFALPFLAFLNAALFVPMQPIRTTRLTMPPGLSYLPIGLIGFILACGLFFTRYGNERMDYFTSQEVEGIQYLYKIAEPGSLFLAVTDFLPWRFQDYSLHKSKTIHRLARDADLTELAALMRDKQFSNTYLILTRSQKASIEFYFGWPVDAWDNFEKALLESDQFKLVFANDDVKIFTLNRTKEGESPNSGTQNIFNLQQVHLLKESSR